MPPPCISMEEPCATILHGLHVVKSLQFPLILSKNHSGLLQLLWYQDAGKMLWEKYETVLWIDSRGKSLCSSPLPFFAIYSLPFLPSWKIVWVFEIKKKWYNPFFFFSPNYLKSYMQIGTCTISPAFLLEEMNFSWHTETRYWDSDPDMESNSFNRCTVVANNKINHCYLLITYCLSITYLTCSILFHLH